MKRTWWIQAVAYAFLTGAAAIILLPSALAYDQVPRFLLRHARQMKPSIELIGGLRLGYEVDPGDVIFARLRLLGQSSFGACARTMAPRE